MSLKALEIFIAVTDMSTIGNILGSKLLTSQQGSCIGQGNWVPHAAPLCSEYELPLGVQRDWLHSSGAILAYNPLLTAVVQRRRKGNVFTPCTSLFQHMDIFHPATTVN